MSAGPPGYEALRGLDPLPLPAVGLLLSIAVVGLTALGIGGSATAVAWPSMADTFTRPISDLGVVVAAFVTGYGSPKHLPEDLSGIRRLNKPIDERTLERALLSALR